MVKHVAQLMSARSSIPLLELCQKIVEPPATMFRSTSPQEVRPFSFREWARDDNQVVKQLRAPSSVFTGIQSLKPLLELNSRILGQRSFNGL